MLQGLENESSLDPSEFKKLVVSRRSVRLFKDTPIPENIVNACLDLALLAPNSSNLQPWEFYWVRTKEKKKELAQACLSQSAAVSAAELIVCVARTDTWKAHAKKMLDLFSKQEVPVPKAVIDYYEHVDPLTHANGDIKLWAVKSSSLAAENLMLAFRSYSFDTCPMEGFDPKWVSKILNLPPEAHITMVIAAGERDPKGIYGPRIRFDRKNFIKEV